MDVNNTPYLLLCNEDELRSPSTGVEWDAESSALVMRQAQQLRLPSPDGSDARAAAAAATPMVMDLHGQVAVPTGNEIRFSTGGDLQLLRDAELDAVAGPASAEFSDLAVGGSGLLAAAYSTGNNRHAVLAFHLGRRWQRAVDLEDAPLRAAVDCDDQVWVLGEGSITLLSGRPLPHAYRADKTRFEPEEINPRDLRPVWSMPLPDDHVGEAVCVDDERVYVLIRNAEESQFLMRLVRATPQLNIRINGLAPTVPYLTDIEVVAAGRLAALSLWDSVNIDAPVLRVPGGDTPAVGLVGERYPMRQLAQPRFVSSLDGVLRYQRQNPGGITPRPTVLKPLPKPEYPAVVEARLQRRLTGRGAATVWHRIYLEACIPAGTAVEVAVAASDDEDAVGDDAFVQQEPLLPHARRSELPFHAPKREDVGLFEVFLQRSTGRVRRIMGRYLTLRLTLRSSGTASPAVHSLRVYYPRFDYQEAYLPRYLRQEESPDPVAEGAVVAANGPDVRERFLAAFEGVLTPLEGTVAEAEKIWSPGTASPENLEWLAGALGVRCPRVWPDRRKRAQVRHAGAMQSRRGTLAGVNLALDIATDGAVQRSEVVLVENFRLRRTMATLLGIDMGDERHPLTLGTGMSGNSIVGESLVLGEDDAREFLALFAPELATETEADTVRAFFDRYSHQVTVLVHGAAKPLLPQVEATLAQEMPAWLQWRVVTTERPFVLGLAPLLGVDTLLEARPRPRPVVLNDTYLGREGQVLNALAFSPRAVSSAGDRQ